MTVVMSSHVVAELEGSCDHVLLIGAGQVRLAGAAGRPAGRGRTP